MASVISAVELMEINDYFSMAVVTVLSYDYVLTFSKEVDLVWRRSFSLMSFLYVLVRYFGLAIAIIAGLWGNVIHGSVPVLLPTNSALLTSEGFYLGTALLQFTEWGSYVFIWAAEGVMIMRVYAMYTRSRVILSLLMLFFVATVAASIVLAVNYYSPKILIVTEVDLIGTDYCVQSPPAIGSILYIHLTIPRVCLDVLLLALAIGRLVKNALEMHNILGKWRLNVYLRMLVRDSVIYFILNLFYIAFAMAAPYLVDLPLGVQYIGIAFCNIAPFMLAPHLIVSFRHYHATSESILLGHGGTVHLSTVDGRCEMHFTRPGSPALIDGVREDGGNEVV
ncbi:hypothetical protein BV22DRAFT_1126216 [Leucogyrophana mollusca]|uniref:Uncharacterized protein n=1 Tax=Leucogyrophana mollusca TaxID=85980 RepID=A0ACB8BTU9_9AGAM|nr:hypothetical protein BV22DRAFT_1126216 [Leucogyrophana mollusca]